MIAWPTEGKENSDSTIRIAFEATIRHDIRFLVIASVTGQTALRALSLQPAEGSVQIVCIGQQVGYSADGLDDMPTENYQALQAAGIPVFKGIHGLAGPSRAVRYTWQGIYPPSLLPTPCGSSARGPKFASKPL